MAAILCQQGLEMWIDLTDAEAAAVIEAMDGKGSVVDKLCARPCEGTGAFVAAAERSAISNVQIERFGVVKRDADGAYVMCWRRITNQEAELADNREQRTSGEVLHAANGDYIFSADLTLCATVYVRAPNLIEARKLVDDHVDDDLNSAVTS